MHPGCTKCKVTYTHSLRTQHWNSFHLISDLGSLQEALLNLKNLFGSIWTIFCRWIQLLVIMLGLLYIGIFLLCHRFPKNIYFHIYCMSASLDKKVLKYNMRNICLKQIPCYWGGMWGTSHWMKVIKPSE